MDLMTRFNIPIALPFGSLHVSSCVRSHTRYVVVNEGRSSFSTFFLRLPVRQFIYLKPRRCLVPSLQKLNSLSVILTN